MAYIQTVSEAAAAGALGDLYAADLTANGYVPNYTQAMSLHPDVMPAWRQLQKTIRSGMRLRRYELVTFAAALALECRY